MAAAAAETVPGARASPSARGQGNLILVPFGTGYSPCLARGRDRLWFRNLKRQIKPPPVPGDLHEFPTSTVDTQEGLHVQGSALAPLADSVDSVAIHEVHMIGLPGEPLPFGHFLHDLERHGFS